MGCLAASSAGWFALGRSPTPPLGEPGPVGPWWGAALVMTIAVVLIGVGVWLIQYWHRKHDERRQRSADALGFEPITHDAAAVDALCEKLAKLRVRLDRKQLRSAHRGALEGWTVIFVDARERDGHYMSLGWVGDGQVEPCPRSLVLLERPGMDLPDFMLEPDNVVYRLARGELRAAKAAADAFERNNRVVIGDGRGGALLSDDLRADLAENRELTVRGNGALLSVSTDTKHVPDRQWHGFLARAMTIAEAIHAARPAPEAEAEAEAAGSIDRPAAEERHAPPADPNDSPRAFDQQDEAGRLRSM